MKKVFCDICGKEITADQSIHKIGFGIVNGDQIAENPTEIEREMDFCDTCITKIMESIRSGSICKTDEPKPKKAIKIDTGRVWALRDAGWKVKDIAKDMLCSEGKIYRILNEDRPAMETAYTPEVAA